MIKTILFDIGGVVTFSDFDALYKNFAERAGILPEAVARFYADNWEENLLGVISLERFFQEMRDAGAQTGLDLQGIWLEEALKIRKVNTELLAAIEKLRKQYKVGVLSNLTYSRMIIDEKMGIYNNFDFTVLSCMEHLKKPDPEFFKLALKRGASEPFETVFVDDMEKNTIAARALGFIDVLYTGNDALFSDFRKLGIVME